MLGLVGKPRALRDDEIMSIIERWAETAKIAKDCGFSGVQVHSAHGYLSSQFLSPRVNRRTDRWGGLAAEPRAAVARHCQGSAGGRGRRFPRPSVKLNSADFQKGGFSNEDAAQVAAWLDERRIDMLEISGGTL